MKNWNFVVILRNIIFMEEIIVVLVVDNKYVILLIVIFYFLLFNLSLEWFIVLYVIDGGIEWWNKIRIN